jgi:hypothetical protein
VSSQHNAIQGSIDFMQKLNILVDVELPSGNNLWTLVSRPRDLGSLGFDHPYPNHYLYVLETIQREDSSVQKNKVINEAIDICEI